MDLVERGKRIKIAREAAGFKQSDIALLLNMSEKNYSHIECGRHDIPRYCIDKLCIVLKIPRLELIKDDSYERDVFDSIFQSVDFGNMVYTKTAKTLYTDLEWMYFEEICNILKVDDKKRHLLILPFLEFMQNVDLARKDETGFAQYMRGFMASRKAKLNDRFIGKGIGIWKNE